MLSITSGAKTHLEGSITNVTFEVQISWDGSTYTDESAYLHSVNIQKKIEDKHLGPVANTFNITMDNTTGRFSWPSESTRTPKKKIKIYADINGEDILVLTGVIDTIEQRRDGTALIKGRDLSAIAIDTPAPQKTYVNQSPEAIINNLWTAATGYTTSSAATGITMDFMNFKSESSVWAAISSICKKTVGRVNVLPDGTLKYESLIGKNYTLKSTADWNCGTDDFDSITEQLSTKDIINAVVVSYKNKQVDENKAAYMLLSDPEGNSVQQDEDERLINWNIGEILAERHRAPNNGVIYLKCGNISSITSVMNDTTSTDITAYCSITDAAKGKVTLSSGFSEGDEIRFKYKVSEMKLAINYGYTPAEGWTFEGEVANPTLSYEFGTGSATITLDSNPDPLLYPDADAVISISSITSGATLTKLWIVGDVAVARIEKFKKFDNTSITVYGRRELHLELEGVSIDDARKVAQRIVDRYKNPSSTSDLSITMHPELDILDVINVYDNIHTNLNMKYEIESLNISYANTEAKCSVQLRQYDTVAWTYTENGITVTAPWDVKKPLATPVFVDTAVTQESITVTWERQFAAINHKLVLKQGTSTIQTAYTSGNNYTFGSLSADTEYTIELTVIGKDGVTYTNSTSATTLAEVAIGDGVAPSTPTGLALTTFFSGGKTYVKAAWAANSETDIKGYEVAWSYDGTNYYNSGLTTELSLVIEVRAGVTVYVKVRAKDIEGFESAWCTAVSITSAKDTTIPADATGITAAGGFDIIYISWTHTKPSDFSHYVLERSPSPYSTWTEIAVVQSKEFIDKNVVAGTYYKYRVKAYDIYGNAATNWVATTSGVTCSSISSELSDLDTRLTNLDFSDIAGYIAGGQITDDTIIARMILAGEIKTLHMDVDEIVGNSAWFGKIVANHIATDAITADKIYAGSVTANKLEATLDLSVGRKITVGSNVQIGKAVGPTGLTGDGIYVSKDAYFRINSGLFMDEGLWMGKSLGERIHPFMTSNTTPSGYEVSNNDGDTYAWYLFRESTSGPISHYVNHWSQIKLPVRKVLKTYNIFSYSSSNCASGWKIQGSNDGTNWTDLDTQSGVLAWSGWLLSDVSISSPGAYLYYRLLITAVTGSYASISSIKLFDAAGWKFSVAASGSDPNYLAWDGQLNLKGNLILGYGENVIEFEDSKIKLGDGSSTSGENYVYFKRGSTGENIAWLSDYFVTSGERNTWGVAAHEYVEGNFSINCMASNSTEANNRAYLKATINNTSNANTLQALLEIMRLSSTSTHGYFKFSHPINVLYATGQDAASMPNGSILVQGDYLFYRDSSGTWKRAATYNVTPS